MIAQGNGHTRRMAETHDEHAGLDMHDRYDDVNKEWHPVHPAHCLVVAQRRGMTACWAMTEPSCQKLFQTSSRRTARLPAASQDFRVTVWLLLCVCVCFARFRGPLLDIFIRIVREIHNVRDKFTYIL